MPLRPPGPEAPGEGFVPCQMLAVRGDKDRAARDLAVRAECGGIADFTDDRAELLFGHDAARCSCARGLDAPILGHDLGARIA